MNLLASKQVISAKQQSRVKQVTHDLVQWAENLVSVRIRSHKHWIPDTPELHTSWDLFYLVLTHGCVLSCDREGVRSQPSSMSQPLGAYLGAIMSPRYILT